MRQIKAPAVLFALLPGIAAAQPATLPPNTVYGRLAIPSTGGPGQAIPFSVLFQSLGTVIGPQTCSSHNWFNTLNSAGKLGCSQPAVADISGFGTGVATALGVAIGTAGSAVVNGGALGTPSSGGAANLTGTAPGVTAGNVTTNANLTGDVTSVGNAATIASNAVTNAKAAQMVAATIKGNPTASTANASDFTIQGLASLASPSSTLDFLPCYDHVSGTIKSCTPGAIASAGVAGVAQLNGQTGNLVSYYSPQLRLTLTSGTAIMTTGVAAATTVFATPAAGSIVPVYDGTNVIPTVFGEVSQTTTDTTKSPAAVAASSVYDIFCWLDSGTPRCTRGPAWTNATTRSAGTALVRVNGLLLNNASITNGPAAQRGTYIGSIASNSGSTIDYVFGAAASGGQASVLNVWNAYNRVDTATNVTDSGVSYTFGSGSGAVKRQARASAGNQITFLIGLQEDGVRASYSCDMTIAASSSASCGVGLDATTSYAFPPFGVNLAAEMAGTSSAVLAVPIGVHVLSANESSPAAINNTYDVAGFGNSNVLSATIRN